MLDTNIVSELIQNPSGPAAQRARAVEDMIAVSITVAAELRYGCAKKASPRLTRKVEDFLLHVPVLPLAAPVDEHYGAIRARLEIVGRPIGSNDLLIAAHAYALGATMVTANTREFERIEGLTIENWII